VSSEYAALVGYVEACRAAGRPDEADGALREIVRLNPREHYAWALLGMAALRRGEPAAALADLECAARLDRGNAQYHNLCGVALGELGRYDEALASLRKALRARPDYAEAHYNAGKVHEKRGDLAASCAAFRRAAAIDPRYPGARHMLGRALLRAGELDEARRVLEAAVAADPGDEWSAVLLGRVLAAARGVEAGLAAWRAAVARLPASGMLARELAHGLLAAGDFAAGWAAYLRRDVSGPAPRAVLPARLPADLAGRTLALQPEQGLGDILFFLRFARLLEQRRARLVVVAPAKLRPLLERCAGFDAVVEQGADAPSDAEPVLIGDLPFLAGADEAVAPLALRARPDRIDDWRARLAAFGAAPYVAVTWRAGTDFRRRAEFGANIRSLFKEAPLDALVGAVKDRPGSIVSVQRQPDPGETEAVARRLGRPVLDAAAMNDDLEDALALLEVLDDYVCVSNTNVHLRAGLGKVGRVLVPYPAEWRWMAGGGESPWFPGWRVHRQSADQSWRAAFDVEKKEHGR
jgi:tetratricopeptide (TPR) repeat protein